MSGADAGKRTLSVSGVFAGYDAADVLHDVNLTVEPGGVTCLLGANGSGKTTLIRAILGLTKPRAGMIRFGDADLTALPTHRIVGAGLAIIPEGRKVFPRCSVEENLRLGAYEIADRAEIRRRMEVVYDRFPRLRERRSQLAGTMSGGEQAMVSIGRGLMKAPELLIIDEPSLGLSPKLVEESFETIAGIAAQGVTVFLVEQNVHQTLAISRQGYLLQQGRVVEAGDAAALAASDAFQRAYFGAQAGH